jgi:hypothetical protein
MFEFEKGAKGVAKRAQHTVVKRAEMVGAKGPLGIEIDSGLWYAAFQDTVLLGTPS